MAKQDVQGDVGATTDDRVKPFPVRDPLPETETAPAPKSGRAKRVVLPLFAALALAAAAWFGHQWWTVGRFMVSTDDAYIQADIARVSARIQGYISDIRVAENQKVAAGDVILTLDDGDYRIALDSAKNRVRTLDETLNRIDAQIEAAKAAVTQAEAQKEAVAATLQNAQLTAERTSGLAKSKTVSQAALDSANAALKTEQARMAGADASVASAHANVAVLKAERAETAGNKRDLQLAVDQAQRDLDLAVLRAPYDGVITNLMPEKGDLVSPGARLAAIVPSGGKYIEAYFKETQLAELAPGTKAHITIDALEGREFEGTITSTAPATGSTFSLIPPDNATGNFTKIVQRVPVRIAFDHADDNAAQIRAGLSAVVEIDTRTTPKD